MKPKDKALKITNRFAKIDPYLPTKDKALFMYEAKQCALICVDEIIFSMPHKMVETKDGKYTTEPNNEYWQQVKQEIIKL